MRQALLIGATILGLAGTSAYGAPIQRSERLKQLDACFDAHIDEVRNLTSIDEASLSLAMTCKKEGTAWARECEQSGGKACYLAVIIKAGDRITGNDH